MLLVYDALLVLTTHWLALQLMSGGGRTFTSSLRLLAPTQVALCGLLFCGSLILAAMFGWGGRRTWTAPRAPVRVTIRALLWSGGLAVAFALLLAIDAPTQPSRLLFIQTLALGVANLVAAPLVARLLVRLAAPAEIGARRVLIAGADRDSRRIAALLEWDDTGGRQVVGLIDRAAAAPVRGRRWPRFPVDSWAETYQLADAVAADELIISAGSLRRCEAAVLARRLANLGVETLVVPHLTRMFVVGAPVRWEAGVPLVRLGHRPPGRWGMRAKRAFDFSVALLAGLLLLPLMTVITLAVKLTSRGPVLHRQRRVGRNGRGFDMYKFRSMIVTSDDSRHRRYVASLVKGGQAAGVDDEGRPIYKIVNDPRVTFVGRLLRRMSLDELPQLINVLRGEMSLVGPRPPLPFEYDLYDDWQRQRLSVTPGMTGLWQVSGRNFLSFEDMVLLDLYYASNWSFLLDLKLIWRTIPEVLYARGAR